jgi:ABC-type branched-subunit amino acid transport system ATPase component
MARRERELEDRAREALDFVGLLHKAEADSGTLSGGQKKLLELARAIVFEAKLILLDEPTAGVNIAIIANIVRLLRRLRDRKIGMFIVEHNMEFVREISDHVVVMAEGTPLTRGSFDDIRAHPLVAEAYLGRSS